MPRALAALMLATTLLTSGGATAAPPAPTPPPVPAWSWPVDAPRTILRPFIAPASAYSAGHRGVDIGGGGISVRAPADGVVHFSGVVVDRPVLSIAHRGGEISSYEPVSSELARGDPVRRGDTVGVLLAGHCSAPCLHLGVRVDGDYVSPLLYLGGMERSVLLPTRNPEG